MVGGVKVSLEERPWEGALGDSAVLAKRRGKAWWGAQPGKAEVVLPAPALVRDSVPPLCTGVCPPRCFQLQLTKHPTKVGKTGVYYLLT